MATEEVDGCSRSSSEVRACGDGDVEHRYRIEVSPLSPPPLSPRLEEGKGERPPAEIPVVELGCLLNDLTEDEVRTDDLAGVRCRQSGERPHADEHSVSGGPVLIDELKLLRGAGGDDGDA